MREALARLSQAAAEVAACSVYTLPDGELLGLVAGLEAVERVLAGVTLAGVREVDGRGLALSQGASCTAVWLRETLGVSIPAARRLQTLASDVDGLPVVRDAVAAGALSVEQARAVVDAVRELPGRVGPDVVEKAAGVLVEQAGQFDPATLRRLGTRILAHVAPEVAEEVDRRKLAAEEVDAHRDARSRYPVTGAAGCGSPDGSTPRRLRSSPPHWIRCAQPAACDRPARSTSGCLPSAARTRWSKSAGSP